MPARFRPNRPFVSEQFPNDGDKPFPIVEVFGYDRHLRTDEARLAFAERWCPFANTSCEKFRQYGYGYCSVTYKSKYDTTHEVYAVCDHRLDGGPIDLAIKDYFGLKNTIKRVEELKLVNPDQSFDFIAIDLANDEFVAIESQAIDLRGGGVGPAWSAVIDGSPEEWRMRFTDEARRKGRSDTVAYGVNMANISKRLGLQVAEKGSFMRTLGAKLYALTQDRCFNYLSSRIPAQWSTERESDWDITFLTFDYTGTVLPNGQHEMKHCKTMRTSVSSFSEALARSTACLDRQSFLAKIKEKL